MNGFKNPKCGFPADSSSSLSKAMMLPKKLTENEVDPIP